MSVAQCYELARLWYPDRLSLDWQPKTVDRMRGGFDDVGLTGPFWELLD